MSLDELLALPTTLDYESDSESVDSYGSGTQKGGVGKNREHLQWSIDMPYKLYSLSEFKALGAEATKISEKRAGETVKEEDLFTAPILVTDSPFETVMASKHTFDSIRDFVFELTPVAGISVLAALKLLKEVDSFTPADTQKFQTLLNNVFVTSGNLPQSGGDPPVPSAPPVSVASTEPTEASSTTPGSSVSTEASSTTSYSTSDVKMKQLSPTPPGEIDPTRQDGIISMLHGLHCVAVVNKEQYEENDQPPSFTAPITEKYKWIAKHISENTSKKILNVDRKQWDDVWKNIQTKYYNDDDAKTIGLQEIMDDIVAPLLLIDYLKSPVSLTPVPNNNYNAATQRGFVANENDEDVIPGPSVSTASNPQPVVAAAPAAEPRPSLVTPPGSARGGSRKKNKRAQRKNTRKQRTRR